jgi:hypothetical protein
LSNLPHGLAFSEKLNFNSKFWMKYLQTSKHQSHCSAAGLEELRARQSFLSLKDSIGSVADLLEAL